MPFSFIKSHHYSLFNQDSYVVEVHLANGRIIECTLNSDSTGQNCLENVILRMEILQFEFFGLYLLTNNLIEKYWIDLNSVLKKQLNKFNNTRLYFAVQYFVPNISIISDDTTRYHYYHCVKWDFKYAKFKNFKYEQAILLAAYCLQAELGNYNEYIGDDEYIKGLQVFPQAFLEDNKLRKDFLVEDTKNMHKNLLNMPNQDAAIGFLTTAQILWEYGAECFTVMDSKSRNFQISFSYAGIFIKPLNIENQTKHFRWSEIIGFCRIKKKIGIIPKLKEKTPYYISSDISQAKYLERILNSNIKFYQNNKFNSNSLPNIENQIGILNLNNVENKFQKIDQQILDETSTIDKYLQAVNDSESTSVIHVYQNSDSKLEAVKRSYMNSQINYSKSLNDNLVRINHLAKVESNLHYYDVFKNNITNEKGDIISLPHSNLNNKLNHTAISNIELSKTDGYVSTYPENVLVDKNFAINSIKTKLFKKIHSFHDLKSMNLNNISNKNENYLIDTTNITNYTHAPSYYEIISKRSNLKLNFPGSNKNSKNETVPLTVTNFNDHCPPTIQNFKTSLNNMNPIDNSSYKTEINNQASNKIILNNYDLIVEKNLNSHLNNESQPYYTNVLYDCNYLIDGNFYVERCNEPIIDRSKSLLYSSNKHAAFIHNSNSTHKFEEKNLLKQCHCISSPDLFNYVNTPLKPTFQTNNNSNTPFLEHNYINADEDNNQQPMNNLKNYDLSYVGVSVGYCSSPTENKEFINIEENEMLQPDFFPKKNVLCVPFEDRLYQSKNYIDNNVADNHMYYLYKEPQYFKQPLENNIMFVTPTKYNEINTTNILNSSHKNQELINYDNHELNKNKLNYGNIFNHSDQEKNISQSPINPTDHGKISISDYNINNKLTNSITDIPLKNQYLDNEIIEKNYKNITFDTNYNNSNIKISNIYNDYSVSDNESWKYNLEKKFDESFILAEFDQVPNKRIRTDCSTANKNIKLNMFNDILPYEDNRVLLKPCKQNPDGYINASWIHLAMPVEGNQKVIESSLDYVIASQGPTESTVVDFWRMIWQTNCYVVVCLVDPNTTSAPSTSIYMSNTNYEFESSNSSKITTCYQYWPSSIDTDLKFSEFEIKLHQETKDEKIGFIMRLLIVKNHKPNIEDYESYLSKKKMGKVEHQSKSNQNCEYEKRLIWHLQYTSWPDYSNPQHIKNFLSFLDMFESLLRGSNCLQSSQNIQMYKNVQFSKLLSKTSNHKPCNGIIDKNTSTNERYFSPAIIHCSSGVGRTGVVILTLLGKKMLEDKSVGSNFDLNNLLRVLRDQRMYLVQTNKLYIFVNKVLSYYLNSLRLI